MLKVENLKKNFGSFQAVKGVSFSVGKGEVLLDIFVFSKMFFSNIESNEF